MRRVHGIINQYYWLPGVNGRSKVRQSKGYGSNGRVQTLQIQSSGLKYSRSYPHNVRLSASPGHLKSNYLEFQVQWICSYDLIGFQAAEGCFLRDVEVTTEEGHREKKNEVNITKNIIWARDWRVNQCVLEKVERGALIGSRETFNVQVYLLRTVRNKTNCWTQWSHLFLSSAHSGWCFQLLPFVQILITLCIFSC